MTADPLDEAIRCLGRAREMDEGVYAGVRWLIPHELAEAAAALRRAGLPDYAERCQAERLDIAGLHEAVLALWRGGR